MTRKIVTHIPQEKFLSIQLLAAAFWASWFALQWCRIFGLGDQLVIMKTSWGHLVIAILFSLVTYVVNQQRHQETDD